MDSHHSHKLVFAFCASFYSAMRISRTGVAVVFIVLLIDRTIRAAG